MAIFLEKEVTVGLIGVLLTIIGMIGMIVLFAINVIIKRNGYQTVSDLLWLLGLVVAIASAYFGGILMEKPFPPWWPFYRDSPPSHTQDASKPQSTRKEYSNGSKSM